MKYCPLELVMMSFSCKDCRPLCTALAEVKWYFLMINDKDFFHLRLIFYFGIFFRKDKIHLESSLYTLGLPW